MVPTVGVLSGLHSPAQFREFRAILSCGQRFDARGIGAKQMIQRLEQFALIIESVPGSRLDDNDRRLAGRMGGCWLSGYCRWCGRWPGRGVDL